MYLDTLITVFVLFTVLNSVFGATCTTSNNTCVDTSYTEATCGVDKVCVCKSLRVPIRTGCGVKFSQPSVAVEDGYSYEILSGKSGTLTCISSATLFEWALNGNTIAGATGRTYTITSASSSTVGAFKCKAKSSSSSSLNSDYSAEVTLTLKLSTDTISTPMISKSTTSLFNGKSVTFNCYNIPIGYNLAKIVYTFDNGTDTSSTIPITSGESGRSVKCRLTDTATHTNTPVSSTENVPPIVDDIMSVGISPSNVNHRIYTTDATITLKCVPDPDVVYIDKDLTYSWLNDSVAIPNANSQTYDIPKVDGTYKIKCSANYTAGTLRTSSEYTITRDGAYLTKPVISSDPSTPVLGGHLTLACGSVVDSASYSWTFGGSVIDGEQEHKIQIDNLTSADIGFVTCTVRKSMVELTSDAFGINAAQVIAKVSILVLGLSLLMSKVFA